MSMIRKKCFEIVIFIAKALSCIQKYKPCECGHARKIQSDNKWDEQKSVCHPLISSLPQAKHNLKESEMNLNTENRTLSPSSFVD